MQLSNEKEDLIKTRDRYRVRYVEVKKILDDIPEGYRRTGLTEGSDDYLGGSSNGGGGGTQTDGQTLGMTKQGTTYVCEVK